MLAATRTQPEGSHSAGAEGPGEASDASIVERVLAGEHAAFRFLYERYAPAVLGFLASRVEDHALAEDALQEAFCRAFAALATFDRTRGFGPWVATIAENVAKDHFRRRRSMKGLGDHDRKDGGAHDPLRVASRREREEVLRAALTALAPEPRRVLILRYERGLTQRETSIELGCSLRTVQTREQEALEKVLALLEDKRQSRGPEAKS